MEIFFKMNFVELPAEQQRSELKACFKHDCKIALGFAIFYLISFLIFYVSLR